MRSYWSTKFPLEEKNSSFKDKCSPFELVFFQERCSPLSSQSWVEDVYALLIECIDCS